MVKSDISDSLHLESSGTGRYLFCPALGYGCPRAENRLSRLGLLSLIDGTGTRSLNQGR